jgi:hypothetical protein
MMDRVQLSIINLLSDPESVEGANRRRPGRMRCESLRCTSGRVMDLSLTGVRVRVRTLFRPSMGSKRQMVFQTAMGPSAPFRCHIQWVKRVGFLRYDLGLEFTDLDSVAKVQLAEMARVHGGRTILRDMSEAA